LDRMAICDTTKYSDAIDFTMKDDSETQMCDRRLLYCVPLPGESDWVKEAFASLSTRLTTRNSVAIVLTNNHSEKRPRETDNNNVCLRISKLQLGGC
jgi:hypothetical protein